MVVSPARRPRQSLIVTASALPSKSTGAAPCSSFKAVRVSMSSFPWFYDQLSSGVLPISLAAIHRVSAEEQPIRRVIAFIPIRVADFRQGRRHQMTILLRHLQARDHPAVSGAVVTVM